MTHSDMMKSGRAVQIGEHTYVYPNMNDVMEPDKTKACTVQDMRIMAALESARRVMDEAMVVFGETGDLENS